MEAFRTGNPEVRGSNPRSAMLFSIGRGDTKDFFEVAGPLETRTLTPKTTLIKSFISSQCDLMSIPNRI